MKKLSNFINESGIEELNMILEADNSWGEIFENVICEAWNSKGKSLGDYEKEVLKRGLDPDTVVKNIYKSLADAKIMDDDETLTKLDNVPTTTDEWYELGMYTKKPNTTPKTDIIVSSKKGVKISVKEESGARLMSGAINETIATIRVAIRESNNKALKDFADDIFKKLEGKETRGRIKGTTAAILKKLGLRENPDVEPDDESEKIIWGIEQAKRELAALIEEIKKFPDVYRALLHEAITGDVKFGENNPASANYILTWDKRGECDVYDVDSYINKFGNSYKIYATYKSSSVKINGVKDGTRDSWMVMTLSN